MQHDEAEPTPSGSNGAGGSGGGGADGGSGGLASESHENGANSSSGSSSNGGPTALFNADEARFMNDSFSSAESFDPFRDGAPGFKVPNVLPAHLGGIGAAPAGFLRPNQGTAADGNGSSGSMAGQGDALADGQGTVLSDPSKARGGYGQNKAWHSQQLQALQAERFKYMAMQQALPLQQRQHIQQKHFEQEQHRMQQDRQREMQLQQHQQQQFQQPHEGVPSGSSSNILMDGGGVGMPAWLPDTSQIGQSLQSMPSTSSLRHPPNPHMAVGLGSLGAQFPSSHHFPGSSYGQSMMGQPAPPPGMMDDNRAGSETWNGYGNGGSQQGHGEESATKKAKGRASKATQAQSQRTSQVKSSPDPDASYTFESAPRPPTHIVDIDKVERANVIPARLREAYFSPSLKRMQPHLKLLRQEQLRRKEKGLSANIRKDRRDGKKTGGAGAGADDEDGDEGEDGGGKKKQQHTLLTEAEKKANHIASEQKRRANIRKGYEQLCALVPSLREEMGSEGDGGDDDDDEEDDEEGDGEDEDGEGTAKRGKKRRAADGAGGDKGESKTGPRSEATILMKAVEHIRKQVGEHHALVVRKQQLQRQIAQQFGADPTPLS